MMRVVSALALSAVTLCCLSAAPGDPAYYRQEPFRLMTAERDEHFRSALPAVASKGLAAILSDPSLILYTEREMPRAYQDWEDFQGVHSPAFNRPGRTGDFGNANREFPWAKAAGTDFSEIESFRFLHLPRDENDRLLPVVYYRQAAYRSGGGSGYGWVFPVGTTLGEVLCMTNDGALVPFEVRTRQREGSRWRVGVHRPFPTAASLSAAIKYERPNWTEDSDLWKLCLHLDTVQTLQLPKWQMHDLQPDRAVFISVGERDELPPLNDDALAVKLLRRPFESAVGVKWREGRSEVHAPTFDGPGLHIVPRRYTAGHVEVSSKSCMRCHDTTNRHASEFDSQRVWWGRVAGSDGILSFHPFAASSISTDGRSRPVRMHGSMEEAGVIAKYDPARHPNRVWHTVPGVK